MSRSYTTRAHLDGLIEQLGPRDWAILDSLAQVRLASANQLQRLHFHEIKPSAAPRIRRRVMQRLTDARLTARLDRRIGGVRAGSAGYVYSLDVAGQKLVLGRGVVRGQPRKPWTPSHPFVAHRLGVTETYVRLAEAAREREDVDIVEFEAEPEAWRPYAGTAGEARRLKPDAYLLLHHGRWEERRFIEYDRGTEGPAQLARQVRRYADYFQTGIEQASDGVFPRVLWIVPDEDRKEQLVDVIAAREPPELWQLHHVTTHDRMIEAVLGENNIKQQREEPDHERSRSQQKQRELRGRYPRHLRREARAR